MTQFLSGKKEICSFVRRSWKTVDEWIATRGFPAAKINGIWESDADMITAWRRKQIAGASCRRAGLKAKGTATGA
jgi:hypothetical protein